MPQCLQCGKNVLPELLARHGICFDCCFQKAWETPVINSPKWAPQSPFITQDDSHIGLHSHYDSSIDWFQSNSMSHAEYQERLHRMFHVPIAAINGGRSESHENFLQGADTNFETSKKELADIITKMTDPGLLMHYRASHFPHDEMSNIMAAGFLFAPICFDLEDTNPPFFRVAGTWRKSNGTLGGCNNPRGAWWALNICKSLIQHRHIYAVQVPWNAIGGVTNHTLPKNSIALVSLTTPQTTSYYSDLDKKEKSVIFCGSGIQFNCMRTVNPHLPLNFIYKHLHFSSQSQTTSFMPIERYFEIGMITNALKFLSSQKAGIVSQTTPLSLKEIMMRDTDMIYEYPKGLRIELSQIIDSYFCTIFNMIAPLSTHLNASVLENQQSVLNFFGTRYRRIKELLIGLPAARISIQKKQAFQEKYNLSNQMDIRLHQTGRLPLCSSNATEMENHSEIQSKFRNYAFCALYKRRSSLAQFRQVVLLAVNQAVQKRLSGQMRPFDSDLE